MMFHSGFELLLCVSYSHFSCVVALDFADCFAENQPVAATKKCSEPQLKLHREFSMVVIFINLSNLPSCVSNQLNSKQHNVPETVKLAAAGSEFGNKMKQNEINNK